MTEVASPPKITIRPASVGTMIDQLWAMREQKKSLETEASEVAEKMHAIEESLLSRMDSEGVDKASGKKASVSFTHSIVANISGDENWDKFYAYIKKTGYFHLLQRRVSDPAYRELLDSGKKVPGAEPFVKKRLNLRTISA